MNLAVFGANGPTGRLLVAQALDAGHAVTAVTRHPTDFPLAHPRLRVVAADVYNFDSVSAAVEGKDAVLSTLGVPYGRKPISVYSVGATNIVRAMDAHGVRRLLAVSSSATDPQDRSRDTGGGFFFEKLLKPIITATLGRTLYADMRLMEEILAASDLDWTVVRPSGLFGTEAVTDYRTAPGFIKGRYTSRRDLAHSMLRELDERRFVRAPMAVATFSEQPTVLQLIRQEALSK
ncbi:MAG: family oxidoreductase [Glaciihabitans sp.]|nr:family oxidoreductase [Glaciihabitans sp.]